MRIWETVSHRPPVWKLVNASSCRIWQFVKIRCELFPSWPQVSRVFKTQHVLRPRLGKLAGFNMFQHVSTCFNSEGCQQHALNLGARLQMNYCKYLGMKFDVFDPLMKDIPYSCQHLNTSNIETQSVSLESLRWNPINPGPGCPCGWFGWERRRRGCSLVLDWWNWCSWLLLAATGLVFARCVKSANASELPIALKRDCRRLRRFLEFGLSQIVHRLLKWSWFFTIFRYFYLSEHWARRFELKDSLDAKRFKLPLWRIVHPGMMNRSFHLRPWSSRWRWSQNEAVLSSFSWFGTWTNQRVQKD